MVESLNKNRLALKKENAQLKERINSFESMLSSEKAALYEQLGTAYVQAKLFDLAIESYTKSLNCNPNNPQLHYNLGLLYKRAGDNKKKSLAHLKKYLQLAPNAKNKKETEYLIKMLGE